MHFYPKAFFRTVIKIYEHCAFRLRKGPIFNAVSTILGNLQRFTRFYFSEIRTAFLVVLYASVSFERFQKVSKGSKKVSKYFKGSEKS